MLLSPVLRSLQTLLVVLLLAALVGVASAPRAHAATAPASANPAVPVVLTPAQAHAALQVLDDPAQRGRVEDTLRAIAAAGALATPASAPAAASAPAPASAATAASAPLAQALRSNGLVMQIADHAAHNARMIGARLLRARVALFNVASARDWWAEHLHTPAGHALLLGVLQVLLLTLVPALLVELLIRRFLERPRRAIAAHWAARHGDGAQTAPPAASNTTGRPAAMAAGADSAAGTTRAAAAKAQAAELARADAQADAEADAQEQAVRAAAGMAPAAVAGGATAGGDPNAGPNANAEANAAARPTATAAVAATADSEETAESAARRERHRLRGALHWRLLQRLPAALLVALLDLLPVIAFGLCAGGVLSLFGPDDTAPAAAVGELVDTYVICRIVLVIGELLFAPRADALRLMPFSDTWAAFSQRWLTRIVIVGGVGGALNAAVKLGMTEDAHLALVKLVALVGHLMLAVMIFQCRHPVAATIRRTGQQRGSLAHLTHWLGDIWAGVAIFIVMALWLVWALDVRGGYQELVRAGGLSLVVLLVARMIAIVALGALGRVFDPLGSREHMTIAQRRAYRYYPALRRLLTAVIWIVTIDLLLHVWNLHPTRIFMSAPIGRLLGSALITIAIAVVVAIAIWEFANGAAERRLTAWTNAGDYVRAARLRTLLPMFRTTLLVAILVVVGLTALSQLGVNTGPLVAGASIFGVALGFGSQKLVQDFITGIFLLTENAMQVGDWVTVAGVSGTVEFLSIRTVRLRGGDGSLYTVPFSSVTTVNNTNRGIGNAAVKVVIAYGEDVQRAVDTLKEIGAGLRRDDAFNRGILSDFAYWGVDQVDGASVTLVGQIQCTDSARWSVQREFNRRVLARFTELGIELANPQRNFLVGMARGDDVEGHAYGDDHDDATGNDRTRAQAQARGASTKAASQGGNPRTGRAGASGDGNGSSSGKPN